MKKSLFAIVIAGLALVSPIAVAVGPAALPQQPAAVSPDQALVNRYCAGCHSTRTRAGNLVLAGVDVAAAGSNPELWEKVVRKMRNGLMPPAGNPRPDEATSSSSSPGSRTISTRPR